MAFRDITRSAALRIPPVRALHSHAQTLAGERDRLVEEARRLAAERDQLRSRLEEAHTDLAQVGEHLEAAERRVREAEASRVALEHRVQLLENSHRVASQALQDEASIRAELADAQRTREDLERYAFDLKADLARANESASAAAGAKIEDLELRLYVATSDAQRAVLLNDQLMRDLRAAHDKLRSLVEESNASSLQAEALRAEIEALQAQGEMLIATREGLVAERAELEASIERQLDMVMRLERTESALQAEMAELRSAQEGFNTERHTLQVERERLEAALEAQTAELAELQQGRAGLEAEAEALRVQAAELQSRAGEVAAAQAALQAVRQELQTARAELEQARLREAEAAGERTATQAELARLAEVQARNQQLSAELTDLRARAAVLEHETERLRNEERRLVQARAELADLHARVAALDSEAARGRDQAVKLTATQAELAALKERLAAAERNAPALQQLALQSTETTALKKELTDARDRLAARLELMSYELTDLNRGLRPADGPGSDAGRRLYLDLLEAALTGTLSEDENMSPWSEHVYDPDRRLYGRDWPKTAKTMIGVARMRNLRRLVETALSDGVEGDLLEAGVWRGGACIYMRGILAAHDVMDRTVWVADSFAGLPPPNVQRYPADRNDPHHTFSELIVPLEEVKLNFAQFHLLDQQVAFLPGWFKDTLPTAPVEKLSVLRLDGDMYGSTLETLEALYHKVSPGGFIIVDDYFLAGCRQAVDDFRAQRRIKDRIEDVDGAAVYWRKGGPQAAASLPRQARGARRAAPKADQA